MSTMSEILGATISEMMDKDNRVVALDGDLGFGDILGSRTLEAYPKRYIETGIAEANMVSMACGMSLKGKIPFIYTFGCFAGRRVMDQIYVSGAYGGANVKIIGAMPGITAEINGGTHMTFEDMALMRTIPNMLVLEPSDGVQGRAVLKAVKDAYGMAYIRWERKGSKVFYTEDSKFEIGKACCLCEGTDATIITMGHICLDEALKAKSLLEEKDIHVRVLDMFTLKPLDKAAVCRAAIDTGAIVTVENHSIIGGLASAVAETMAEGVQAPLEAIGIKDVFGQVGRLEELKDLYGLTGENIASAVERAIARKGNTNK